VNDQLPMFDAGPSTTRARRTDPDTSRLAAYALSNLSDARRAVLGVLVDLGGLATDERLAEAYTATEGLIRQSPSGLRTRRSELVDLGLVRDSLQRVRLPSGRWSIVWAVVT
jgi:hypothetical protein